MLNFLSNYVTLLFILLALAFICGTYLYFKEDKGGFIGVLIVSTLFGIFLHPLLGIIIFCYTMYNYKSKYIETSKTVNYNGKGKVKSSKKHYKRRKRR